MNKENQRPPLGVVPEFIWKEIRIKEILAAMERYAINDKPIPSEWVKEIRELFYWFITNREEWR